MPHLVKVQEQYKQQGLIIFGAHCQDPNKDGVVSVCRSNRVNFSVYQGARLTGDESKGIPHAYLFDASGKCVKEGHVSEFTSTLEELLRNEPHWIAKGKKLTSSAKTISDGLKGGKSLGWALGECESVLKKNDDKAKEEAGYLKEQIEAEAQRMLAEAKDAEEKDPLAAQGLYSELSKTFGKKNDAGKDADARLKELAKDKPFQEELKAAKVVAQLNELAGQLKTGADGKYDLSSPANRQTAGQIQAGLKAIKSKHAATKVGQKCLEDMKAYGFN